MQKYTVSIDSIKLPTAYTRCLEKFNLFHTKYEYNDSNGF